MSKKNFFSNTIYSNGVSLLAGALLTFAFAPYSYYPLAFISPLLLALCLESCSPRQAFNRGWFFGIGLFGTGVYWVFISIHLYGNASIPLAAFITAVFILLLALFPALSCFLLNRYFPTNHITRLLSAFPMIWVFIEFLRARMLTGFPWLLIGTSQVNSPLSGFAPLLGVYGLSFIVIFCSGLLLLSCKSIQQRQYRKTGVFLSIFLLLLIVGKSLTLIKWTKPEGSPVKVSLIQGNIPQDLHWTYDELIPTLEKYQKLTEAHWDSRVIIWPESAIPIPLQEATEFVDFMSQNAKQHESTILAGVPVKLKTENSYYNAVIAFGKNSGFYVKRRLVPFGEYTPYPGIFGRVLNHFNIPMSNMREGQGPIEPLLADHLKISAFVCYEIAFPELVAFRDSDANVLLTVSNDAWFGESIALAQHLEMAQMRSLELQKPGLFVSNTGITAIIRPNGQLQSAAPVNQTFVLTDVIQAYAGETYWQSDGMETLFIILFLNLIIAVIAERTKASKKYG